MASAGMPASGGRYVGGGSMAGFGNVGNPGGYYGGSVRISAEDPQNQAGNKAIGGRRVLGPDGKTTYETEYGESTEDNLRIRDKYNAQAEARRQASLQALMSQYGTGGGSGNPGQQPPQVAFDENAARQAAFARAKDQAGNIARSSVDALREMLGGNLGGAKEAAGLAGVAGGAANELGEFNRDQLMLDLNRAGELSDRDAQLGLERERMSQDRWRSLLSLFSEGKGPIY